MENPEIHSSQWEAIRMAASLPRQQKRKEVYVICLFRACRLSVSMPQLKNSVTPFLVPRLPAIIPSPLNLTDAGKELLFFSPSPRRKKKNA